MSAPFIPPTSERRATSKSAHSISGAPSKDTTIYEADTTSSNGAGDSFWVRAASGIAIPDQLRSLIAFDVGAAIPAGVTILDARIELTVLSHVGNSTVILSGVPRNAISWTEGPGNASGDESTPPGPVVGGASWSHRNWASIFPQGPWTGGAFQVPALDGSTAKATGTVVLASPELVDHVITLASTSALHDGLILHTTTGTARLASDENPIESQRPRLIVDYTIPPTLSGSGINIPTSTSSFINENQSFRWLYDLDHDDILITSVLGRCEVTDTVGFLLPYTYQFQGSPSFAGVDCCTWQLDSATGISGTGQALFFVNVDASHPANQPPDSDLDGIKNLCDNCPSISNGPLLGSCFSGSRAGSLCRSNQECSGGFCSFAQDDVDLHGLGDACVPEPGVGSGLASGLIAMAWLCRRSRIFPRRVACPARDSTD